MKTKHMLFFVCVLGLCGVAYADYMQCPANPSGTHIRPVDRFFDVVPKIIPANTEATVDIIPLFDHVRPQEGCEYTVLYTPVDMRAEKNGWVPGRDKSVSLTHENGVFKFTKFFEGEQEHILYIEEIKPDKKRRTLGSIHLYSLDPDLYAFRPFKGDFHMHSNYSDGVESPAYVAGACRRAGLDFMGLSDHGKYAGSVKAIETYKGLPIDLRIYNAEEVHAKDNPVHIVSFGASSSIADLYGNEAAYRAEVAEIQKTLGTLPAGVDPFQYASCLWVFGKIRERGGLGMFAHPYWQTSDHYYISEALRTYLFDTQPFDALELISGFPSEELYECDTNALQVARYQEERVKGKKIPICGISDTHGIENSEQFGRYYTVCFAPSADLTDLIASIKGLNSVAVEAVKGDLPRAYGPFRLVKYTLFLLREVFPRHDELCFEEGRLMLQYAAGDKSAVERLKQCKGQTVGLYDRLWSKRK